MKTEEWVQTIERFSLDVLGTIIPGAVLLVPSLLLLPTNWLPSKVQLMPLGDSFAWCGLITVAYVLGHLLGSIGSKVVTPYVPRVIGRGWRIVGEPELSTTIRGSRDFKTLAMYITSFVPAFEVEQSASTAVKQLRNIAMSMIDGADRQTVYRFMFISLLNQGVATAICILFVCTVLAGQRAWLAGAIALTAVPFLLERGASFYARAIRVPFSMVGHIVAKRAESAVLPGMATPLGEHVYLAGGLRSNWQDFVIRACPALKFFDPREHGLSDATSYTSWDLEAIRRCRWLFAYLERDNPGGYALALELGYARALGKEVIFVDEKSRTGNEIGQYLEMLLIFTSKGPVAADFFTSMPP